MFCAFLSCSIKDIGLTIICIFSIWLFLFIFSLLLLTIWWYYLIISSLTEREKLSPLSSSEYCMSSSSPATSTGEQVSVTLILVLEVAIMTLCMRSHDNNIRKMWIIIFILIYCIIHKTMSWNNLSIKSFYRSHVIYITCQI